MYLTAEDLRDIIRDGSGIEYMTEYTISYARFLLRSWGFTRKVPMGRHVKRASRQKIAWFRKKLGPLVEGRMRAGYTVCVQDEAICVADARLRKGVYTPKGIRGAHAYTGSHSKTALVDFGDQITKIYQGQEKNGPRSQKSTTKVQT